MVDTESGPRRKRRTPNQPAPSRWARAGVLMAQIIAAAIILVGLQYLLRELANVVLSRGP